MASFEPASPDSPPPPSSMDRGAHLRQLRALAAAAEAEAADTEDPTYSNLDLVDPETGSLLYDSYLAHQSYYDDLKHVDHPSITYSLSASKFPGETVVIAQDKSLGKGGLCWDAAFVLAEHLAAEIERKEVERVKPVRVVELGAGTGVAGIYLFRHLSLAGIPSEVTVTDLPALLPLLSGNAAAAAAASSSSLPPLSSLTASPLAWGSDDEAFAARGESDYVIGADIVASLYSPTDLARTIWTLAGERTRVVVSFKGRESEYHDRFEEAMREKYFERFEVVRPDAEVCRNRNPGVGIIVAGGRKRREEEEGAERGEGGEE